MRVSRIRSLALAGVLVFTASSAMAEGGSSAAAEALFQDGRALFRAGKIAEACPKLAESQRLDPATGTLLALALCHEQQRKFASAWAEFTDVEARARREGRKDRMALAREHAASLRPRLSTLLIEVPAEVASTTDFEVRVDGVAIGAGSFGVAVPVDGGDHLVEATATGRNAFKKTFSVKPESDAVRATIPLLDEAATPTETVSAPTPEPESSSAVQAGESPRERRGGGLRIAGVVCGGVGLLAVGTGGVLALLAKSRYAEAKKQCNGSICDSGPYDDIDAARGQGTLATVVIVAGGAALAGGATLWLLAPKAQEQAPPTTAALRLERIGVGAGNVVVGGSF